MLCLGNQAEVVLGIGDANTCQELNTSIKLFDDDETLSGGL